MKSTMIFLFASVANFGDAYLLSQKSPQDLAQNIINEISPNKEALEWDDVVGYIHRNVPEENRANEFNMVEKTWYNFVMSDKNGDAKVSRDELAATLADGIEGGPEEDM